MQTEDLIVKGKLDIEIKSDWLLICFTFVMKSPGILVVVNISTTIWTSQLVTMYDEIKNTSIKKFSQLRPMKSQSGHHKTMGKHGPL